MTQPVPLYAHWKCEQNCMLTESPTIISRLPAKHWIAAARSNRQYRQSGPTHVLHASHATSLPPTCQPVFNSKGNLVWD